MKKSMLISAACAMLFMFPPFGGIKGGCQNIGISTDGSTPETGVLLDVKGINSKTVTATQNIFQIKSFDASTEALKLRLGLATNATYSLSYGIIDVPEYVGNAVSAYRHLVLQPSGGNVGIGTTTPTEKLSVNGALVTQNGQVKRDFATFNNNNVPGPAIPFHILTNIDWNCNMYRIVVEGYNFGTGRPIFSEIVGYACALYGDPNNVVSAFATDYGAGATISQYKSSGGFVVVKLTNAASFYYVGFSVSAWLTNPAGNAFNISATIVQQNANL